MSAGGDTGLGAIGLLSEKNRRSPSAEIEAELVRLRIEAGRRAFEAAKNDSPVSSSVDDRFPEVRGLPEVTRETLDGDSLASGIVHHGALIVRGLYDAAQLRRLERAAEADETSGPGAGDGLGCSPHTLFELLEIYRETGLLEPLRAYLGEQPLLFGERVKLRRHQRERDRFAAIPWHQDAAFFGRKCHAVNCWAAVSPCGEENPGLSIIPGRTESIHGWDPSQGHAPLDYGRSIPEEEFNQLVADHPPVACVLQPGDAVLFDEMTVHETLLRPWRRDEQLVTISWFFPPAGFPAWGTPVAL
jgi:hypothetical protein